MNNEIKDIYKKASVATICTALFKKGLKNQFIQGISPLNKKISKMLGLAFTVRYIPAREDLNSIDVFKDPNHPQRVAVEECPKDYVMVFDSRKDPRAASAGSILLTRMMVRGCAGVVTDGGFRDSHEIKNLNIPTYHNRPSSPTNLTLHQAIDINVPIGCGDVAVWPNDLIVGDQEGVVVVPNNIITDISTEVKFMTIYEDYVLKKVKKGSSIRGLYPLTNEDEKNNFEAWLSKQRLKIKGFFIMNKLQSDNLLNALCLHDNDNILITLKNLNSGMVLNEYGITMDAPALSGQKIARFDIEKDDPIIKYGTVIGFADSNIKKGQVLTNKNVLFKEFNREHNYCSKYKPTNYIENNLQKSFMGYKRQDGRVGTRNYIAIVSTVNCSATVVHEIASYFTSEKLKDYKNIDGVAAFSHSTGCGMELSGEPMNLLYRTLGGYIKHPNVAATLVVGLGCERCQVGGLFQNQKLDQNDPFVETLIMQENGGTSSTIKAGIEIVKKMLDKVNNHKRVITPVSSLMVGLQCGGSDAFSSLTANPALGKAVDLLVENGGTAVLSETPEIYGVEHTLTARAINVSVAEKLMERVDWWKNVYSKGRDVQINGVVSPGNQMGGLANILEKSLGSAMKGGSTGLMEVYKYAERITERGFVFMDTPGFDPVSATGQIAGGANLIAFTTGRGSCFGAKPSPSIKLATNTTLFNKMEEDMDINCGKIVDGILSLDEMGEEIFNYFIDVASGKKTKSEILSLGRHEFAPWQIGITG